MGRTLPAVRATISGKPLGQRAGRSAGFTAKALSVRISASPPAPGPTSLAVLQARAASPPFGVRFRRFPHPPSSPLRRPCAPQLLMYGPKKLYKRLQFVLFANCLECVVPRRPRAPPLSPGSRHGGPGTAAAASASTSSETSRPGRPLKLHRANVRGAGERVRISHGHNGTNKCYCLHHVTCPAQFQTGSLTHGRRPLKRLVHVYRRGHVKCTAFGCRCARVRKRCVGGVDKTNEQLETGKRLGRCNL